MSWCEECWSQDRKTVTATKVLDESDLCDLHYRRALGEGLPAVPKNVPPMPPVSGAGATVAPIPNTPNFHATEVRLPAVTVSAASVPPTNEKTKRLCACGCGTALVNRHPYIKGHNPEAKKKATPAPNNGKEKRPVAIRGGQVSNRNGDAATVTVGLQASHLDALWARLSLQEKADKLFPAE